MAETLDVYRDWLKIEATERPLNHYQLLRLKQFEDDPERIRKNYRKLNAHVRKFASGQYADASQELLNELARAMLCLTDARRKAEYDASLGRKEAARGRRTLEEILLSRQLVDTAQLAKARNYANAVGCDIREALLQQKLATPTVVMQAYAESVGLPFVELGHIELDADLLRRIPAMTARKNSCAPILVDDGQLLIASPNELAPDVEDDLRLRTGMPVRLVFCTAADINALIKEHYPKDVADAEVKAGASSGEGAAEAGETEQDDGLSPQRRAQLQQERMLITGAFCLFGFLGVFLVGLVIENTGPVVLAIGGAAAVAGAIIGWVWGGKRR